MRRWKKKEPKKNRSPGLFSWLEFSSSDTSKTIPFFLKLFNWTSDHSDFYTQVRVDNQLVGGIYKPEEKDKITSPFHPITVYISSENVDADVPKIIQNGGKVVKEPFDVMDKGRMGVFKDAEGADFCIWQGKNHYGIPPHGENNYLTHGFPCWYELNCKNVEVARNFYCNVFGWDYFAKDFGPMVYTCFFKGEEQVGGMVQMTSQWPGDLPSHWMTYFTVDNIDETVIKVKELGGTVCTMPTLIDGMNDRMAMVNDPTGIAFQVMDHVPQKKRQWRLETMELRSQVGKGNLKVSQLERRIKKLKEILKKHSIKDEELEEECKKGCGTENEDDKKNLKRKLSNGSHKEEGCEQETKKRKKNIS